MFGIIDEIVWRPTSGPLAMPPPPNSRSDIISIDPSPPSTPVRNALASLSRHRLYLKDHKTRTLPYLPSESDSLSNRIQLMLYKTLLEGLLSPSNSRLPACQTPLDFPTLFTKLELSPTAPFTSEFQNQILDTGAFYGLGGDGNRTWTGKDLGRGFALDGLQCLNDLVPFVYDAIEGLGLEDEVKVDPTLELVYIQSNRPGGRRMTGSKRRKSGDGNGATKRIHESEPQVAGVDDKELQWAIMESLKGSPSMTSTPDSDSTCATKASSSQGSSALGLALNDVEQKDMGTDTALPTDPRDIDEDEDIVLYNPFAPPSTIPVMTDPGSSPPCPSPPPESHTSTTTSTIDMGNSSGIAILGTREFQFDGDFLTNRVRDVLQFWTGERDARGVSDEDAKRCWTCEYREGCEWREAKAAEATERFRRNKQAAEALNQSRLTPSPSPSPSPIPSSNRSVNGDDSEREALL